ncbi:MAG TPA: aminoglycoside phosphotransferase family protein [Ktedonobacteraceae bacterium]|nr:aminoglycoside phosphotransferase family protein [Ktedonobacteraceae bacterium]
MQPVELLQRINTLHKTTFIFLEKYPDGEQGAFVVTDRLIGRWVLKWAPGASNLDWMRGVKTVTNLLRSLNYPAPRYLLIGSIPEGIYSIQSVLPGSPIHQISPAHLPRLFALNELQIGRALPDRKDWHQEVINTVLQGGDGYCLHESLLQHSPDTAELLQALQALVMAHQDEPHRSNDIVHRDFQHANILIEENQISGVVDWDGFGTGDCIFDIATLLFYSESIEAREQLWNYALGRASLRLLSIYLAHLILRQVDWSLRYHDQTTSERYITRGQTFLREIARRSHSIS